MPKVVFKLDKEKALYNLWETCNQDSSYGHDFKKHLNKTTRDICEGKDYQKVKKELYKKWRDLFSSKLVTIALKSANETWREINNEYFKRLEKIMNKPIYTNSFTGYITF